MECVQPFFDDLLSVVETTARFSSVQKASLHLLVAHFDIEEKLYLNFIANDLLPGVNVLLIPRKSIHHYHLLPSSRQHLLQQPLHHDFAGSHFALFHLLGDFLCLLSVGLEEFPEDISD